MNRIFRIFVFIFYEVANHFEAVRKIWVVKGNVLVVEGLNIIKKGGKDQESIQNQVPHLTQDTKWESNNHTISHHKREPRGQPFLISHKVKRKYWCLWYGGPQWTVHSSV